MQDISDFGIILCQADGTMRPNAEAVIYSVIAEADDAASRHQLQLLWADETRRYVELGRESYTPSALSQKILARYRKSSAQRFAAGMVALSFLIQSSLGEPSLNAAIDITQRATKHYHQSNKRFLEQMNFREGAFRTQDLIPVTDWRGIEKAHTRFRRVAHLLAADLIATSFLSARDPINRSPTFMHRFIATAAHIEHQLKSRASDRYSDILSVISHIPVEAQSAETFLVGGYLERFIWAGLSPEQIEKAEAASNPQD